jgi:hypothetical protein
VRSVRLKEIAILRQMCETEETQLELVADDHLFDHMQVWEQRWHFAAQSMSNGTFVQNATEDFAGKRKIEIPDVLGDSPHDSACSTTAREFFGQRWSIDHWKVVVFSAQIPGEQLLELRRILTTKNLNPYQYGTQLFESFGSIKSLKVVRASPMRAHQRKAVSKRHFGLLKSITFSSEIAFRTKVVPKSHFGRRWDRFRTKG